MKQFEPLFPRKHFIKDIKQLLKKKIITINKIYNIHNLLKLTNVG